MRSLLLLLLLLHFPLESFALHCGYATTIPPIQWTTARKQKLLATLNTPSAISKRSSMKATTRQAQGTHFGGGEAAREDMTNAARMKVKRGLAAFRRRGGECKLLPPHHSGEQQQTHTYVHINIYSTNKKCSCCNMPRVCLYLCICLCFCHNDLGYWNRKVRPTNMQSNNNKAEQNKAAKLSETGNRLLAIENHFNLTVNIHLLVLVFTNTHTYTHMQVVISKL